MERIQQQITQIDFPKSMYFVKPEIMMTSVAVISNRGAKLFFVFSCRFPSHPSAKGYDGSGTESGN